MTLVNPFRQRPVSAALLTGWKKAVGERMKAVTLHHSQPERRPNRQAFRTGYLGQRKGHLSNYGYVTVKIPKRADMERFSTMAALDVQATIVANRSLDKVHQSIFDRLQTDKGKELKGIQRSRKIWNPKPKHV